MFTSRNDPLLSSLNLTTLDSVRSYTPTDRVKNHRGHRDIYRLHATSPDGRPLTLYLKRLWKTAKKDGLKSLLRHGQVRSVSRREWLNYESLQSAGIPTPALIAVGEDLAPLWERFSFILTAAAPGQPLDDFLRSTPLTSPLRKPTLHALALFIRKLHNAGLFSPDLFTRHIFIDFPSQLGTRNQELGTQLGTGNREPGTPTFTLIDMARLDRSSPHNPRLRARDLAALNITAPLSMVTRTERLRFLRDYDPAARILVPRIRRRVNYLLKRRKYEPFLQ